MRPYLLLDVDGVLNPLTMTPPSGFERHELQDHEVWLSRRHGEWLNELARWFDLVWATTWEHDAPRLIAPRIGLRGEWAVIEFRRGRATETWKLRDIEAFVGDRPFAWIDDEIGPDAHAWAERRQAPTLLIDVNAPIGLTEEHVKELHRFGRSASNAEGSLITESDIRLSRYMSYLLRHSPTSAGLDMDEQGWVSLDALVGACTESGHADDAEHVRRVVRENDKRRFEISAGDTAIRAVQGHSIDLDLGLAPTAPPSVLFHGTVSRFIDRIRIEGLRPMARTHVHLSGDIATARQVGERRGTPLVLPIDAASMHAAGFEFFQAANGVWLVTEVPPEFIGVPGENG